MADWVLFLLLLVSSCANLLALGAFWAVPSLRTVANRFVINLLVANIASCLLLLPCIIININETVVEEIPSLNPLIFLIEENNNISYIEVNNSNINESWLSSLSLFSDDFRNQLMTWACDLVGSWGSLAVLLVVGDTWCAVTDPLRYHARINSPRAWWIIVIGWSISTTWGLVGMFRPSRRSVTGTFIQNASFINNSMVQQATNVTENNYLFDVIFSSTYFTFIIFVPFALICGMYWRIFCAARESSLRMRQNGSSPLLQSDINLIPAVPTCIPPTPPVESLDALTMAIDRNGPLVINMPNTKINTINEQIRRNHSARQLFFEKDPSKELRHVQSTPDFQKQQSDSDAARSYLPEEQPIVLPTNERPSSISYINSLRHRLSNASSLFRYREESRAARISILVVIMFLISFLPYGVIVLIRGNLAPKDLEVFIPSGYKFGSISLLLLGNLSSPFIFAYRNKRVRRGVRIFLGVDTKTNERLNRCVSRRNSRVSRSASRNSTNSNNSGKYNSSGRHNCTFYLNVEPVLVEAIQPLQPLKKKSILKRICDSSKSLSSQCAAAAGKTNQNQCKTQV